MSAGLPYRVVPLGVCHDWRPLPRTLRLSTLHRSHIWSVGALIGRKSFV
jgi:hypothetical protein